MFFVHTHAFLFLDDGESSSQGLGNAAFVLLCRKFGELCVYTRPKMIYHDLYLYIYHWTTQFCSFDLRHTFIQILHLFRCQKYYSFHIFDIFSPSGCNENDGVVSIFSNLCMWKVVCCLKWKLLNDFISRNLQQKRLNQIGWPKIIDCTTESIELSNSYLLPFFHRRAYQMVITFIYIAPLESHADKSAAKKAGLKHDHTVFSEGAKQKTFKKFTMATVDYFGLGIM